MNVEDANMTATAKRTVLGDFNCPLCFTDNILTSEELVGYCHACLAYTGLSPWAPTDGDDRCQQCSRVNAVWWVQSEVWNAVLGDERETVLCLGCFIIRAEEAGVGGRGAWQLYPPPA